jgi:hypothetical protein
MNGRWKKKRYLIEKAKFKEELIYKHKYFGKATLLKMFQKNGLKSSKGVTAVYPVSDSSKK